MASCSPARLLACPPVCWLPLSAGLVCSPAACVSALAAAQRPNPPAQLYDVELLPTRAQGPNLSAHVCVMWQLVAPHKRKRVIKQVLVDGPAFPLPPMELRRDETVVAIPPTVDTLCARATLGISEGFSLSDAARSADKYSGVRNTLVHARERGS